MKKATEKTKSDNAIVLGGIFDNRAERYVHIGGFTNENALVRAMVAVVAFSADKTLSEFQSDYSVHRLAYVEVADGSVSSSFEDYGRVDFLRRKIEGGSHG